MFETSNKVIDFEALKAPFAERDLKWRIGMARCEGETVKWAQALPYIDNQAIMDRLDRICGPENWKNEYLPFHETGQICGISIRVNGEWITKWDGADQTDVEPVKGGLTGAMKRAAVQWGIGRYLYEIGMSYADIRKDGILSGQAKSGGKTVYFKWNPPRLSGKQAPKQEVQEQPSAIDLPPFEGDWGSVVVHKTKLAGKTLADLSPEQLGWFQHEWLPNKMANGFAPEDETLMRALLASMNSDGSKQDGIPF